VPTPIRRWPSLDAGGAIAAFVASRVDCSGLILLDGVIGDRAFTENAAAQFINRRWSTTLPNGSYRRRAIRAAFEETWASLLASDSLGALAQVRCPTLIVHATRPWIEGHPYLTDSIIAAQRKAILQSELFIARQSSHPMLVRDPEPGLVAALSSFVLSLREGAPYSL
jgi:pimeloyl-ACP methyl ester carboxylesterase